jgi:pSer/pThr/pTyr-binding forkhead associated (FHA) protein
LIRKRTAYIAGHGVWSEKKNETDGVAKGFPTADTSIQHAAFEIKGSDYLIRDQGSTNGTTLNGKRLEKKPMKIQDKDIVGFARYEFTIVFPEWRYNLLKSS